MEDIHLPTILGELRYVTKLHVRPIQKTLAYAVKQTKAYAEKSGNQLWNPQ